MIMVNLSYVNQPIQIFKISLYLLNTSILIKPYLLCYSLPSTHPSGCMLSTHFWIDSWRLPSEKECSSSIYHVYVALFCLHYTLVHVLLFTCIYIVVLLFKGLEILKEIICTEGPDGSKETIPFSCFCTFYMFYSQTMVKWNGQF